MTALANRCRRCNRWLHVPDWPHAQLVAKAVICNCEEPKTRCRIVGCRNAARYHVEQYDGTWLAMYCGLCDLVQNKGRGKLRRELDNGR